MCAARSGLRGAYGLEGSGDGGLSSRGSEQDLLQMKSRQVDTLLKKFAELETSREQLERTYTDEARRLQAQLSAAYAAIALHAGERDVQLQQLRGEKRQLQSDVETLRATLSERDEHIRRLTETARELQTRLHKATWESPPHEQRQTPRTHAAPYSFESEGVGISPIRARVARTTASPTPYSLHASGMQTSSSQFGDPLAHASMSGDGEMRGKAQQLVIAQLKAELQNAVSERDHLAQELARMRQRLTDAHASASRTTAANAYAHAQEVRDKAEQDERKNASEDQKSAVKTLEERFNLMESRLLQASSEKSEYASDLVRVQAENTRISTLLVASQKREAQLEEQVRITSETCREKESALDSRIQQVMVLEQSLATLREQYTSALSEQKKIEERAAKALQERERRAQDARAENELLVASLEKAAEASAATVRDLKSQLDAATVALTQLREELAHTTATLQETQRRAEDMRVDLGQYETAVSGLQSDLTSSQQAVKDHAARVAELTGALSSCRQEREAQEQSNQALIRSQETKIKTLQRDVQDRDETIRTLRSEVSEKQTQLVEHKDRLSAAESTLRITTESHQRKEHMLQDEVAHAKMEAQRAKQGHDDQVRTIAKLRGELESKSLSTRAELDSMEQRHKLALAAVQEENEHLQGRLSLLSRELNEEKTRAQAAAQQQRELLGLNETQKHELTSTKTELAEMSQTLTALQARFASVDQEATRLKQQEELLMAASTRLEAQLKTERTQHDAANAELRALLDEKEKLIETLREDHTSIVSNLEAANAALTESLREVNAKLSAMSLAQTTQAATLQQTQERLDAATADNDQLRQVLRQKEAALDDVQRSLEQMKNKAQQSQQRGDALQEEVSSLSQKLTSAQQQLAEVNEAREEERRAASQLQVEMAQKELQLEDARQAIELLEESTKAMQDQLQMISVMLERERTEHSSTRQTLEDLEILVAEKEAAANVAQGQIERAKEELETLRRNHKVKEASLQERLDQEVGLCRQRIAALDEQLAAARKEASLARETAAEQRALASKLEAALERARETETKLQAELAAVRAAHTAAQLACQQGESDKAAALERVSRLTTQLEAVTAEHDSAQSHWQQLLKDRDRRIEAMGKQGSAVSALEERLQALQTEVQHSTAALEASIAERNRLMAALQHESALVASTSDTLADVQSKLLEKEKVISEKNSTISELNLRLMARTSNESNELANGGGLGSPSAVLSPPTRSTTAAAATVAGGGSGSSFAVPPTLSGPYDTYRSGNPLSTGRTVSEMLLDDQAALEASLEREDLEAQLQDMRAQLNERSRELVLQHRLWEELQQRLQSVSHDLASSRAKNNELLITLSAAEDKIAELQVKVAKEQASAAEMKLVHEQTVGKLQATIGDTQRALEDARSQARLQSVETVGSSDRLNKLNLELAGLHAEHSGVLSKVVALERELSAAKAANESLLQRLAVADQREEHSLKEIGRLTDSVTQLTSSLAHLEAEHARQLQATQKERDTTIHDLQIKSTLLSTQLNEARHANANLEQQLTRLQELKQKEVVELEALCHQERRKYEEALVRVEELDRKMRAVQMESDRHAASVKGLQQTVETYQAEVEHLRQNLDARMQQLMNAEDDKADLQARLEALELRTRKERASLEATSSELRRLMKERATIDGLLEGVQVGSHRGSMSPP